MNSPNAAQRLLEPPNNVSDLPDDCLLRPSVSKVPGVNAGSTRSIGQHGGGYTNGKNLKSRSGFQATYNRSIVVSRAFITSQSAAAHFLLFRRIFQVAEVDTGKPFRIRHIHGDGLDSVTADGHQGQAVGFGRFCQELSKGMMGYCAYEQTKALHKLSAYDHLKRVYRYCFSHYIWHVVELRGHIEGEVLTAMMSLASADALPADVYEKILFIIHNSGKKGKDWLKDKEAGEGWPMAAIYWGKSFMPLSVWKAAPSTSNGNEQAHRNINRDGIKLSILAGAMIGYHLDSRVMSMLEVGELLGIDTNNQATTHFRRSGTSGKWSWAAKCLHSRPMCYLALARVGAV
ncbi:hypothetical protein M422DRAFT_249642 [Sphaerobolus stellatus SS14]|uniref:Unplaced genomic scaffold SPHSTscaffold_30, whole genome shotgun sequence n=1 Tax=Sphaerobolus stellatus (strain SS14) TaxID=990650 RepID=A0A0C9VHX4_SPHS4|nr:hypothetical protein M422DRAFT_249642 [Sphaerobolus stellatus SS14]